MMRLMLIVFAIGLLLTRPVAAQLTPDQETLLEAVRSAYATSADWQSYALARQTSTNAALTIFGTDVLLWQTYNAQTDTTAEIDLANTASQGEIFSLQNSASADEIVPQAETQLRFLAINGQVFVDQQNERVEVTDSVADYTLYGLPSLVSFEAAPDINGWLDNALAVYDLGVTGGVQGYQLDFTLTDSLPYIPFDMEAFTADYAEVVEDDALRAAIDEIGLVTLVVEVEVANNTILKTSLLIQIPVEVEGAAVISVPAGDGIFELDYAHQIDTQYSAIGETFEIVPPEE